MANLRIIWIIVYAFFVFVSYGQVGIGTTDPQNTLHVNGGLRVDTIPTVTAADYFLVPTDQNDLAKMVLSTAPSSSNTVKYIVRKTSITEVQLTTAQYESGNIDLGFFATVSIPPGDIATVDIYFKVPIYVKAGSNEDFLIYTGIRVFENGTRLRYCDTKNDMPVGTTLPFSGQSIFRMNQSEGNILEELNNTSGTSTMVVTYELKGYIEKYLSEQGCEVTFGGYSGTVSSFNEGAGYMVVRVNY